MVQSVLAAPPHARPAHGGVVTRQPRAAGDLLTLAFGTTVAMWVLLYLTHLPGATVPRPVVVGLLLMVMLAGGAVAGRISPRGVRAGLYSGLIVGLVNLLVLGSLLGGPQPDRLAGRAGVWVTGWLAASAIIGLCGALIGRLRPRRPPRPLNWSAALLSVCIVATFCLISIGGVVTGYQAGLAVPDWPNSYGYNMFLYPLSRMTGGIYYEHAHRLFGSLVGLTTVAMCVHVQLAQQRWSVRLLALLAVVAVIVQGLLGALRVTGRFTWSAAPEELAPQAHLAIVHGVVAQLFLALLVVLRVMTSRGFGEDGPGDSSDSRPDVGLLPGAALPEGASGAQAVPVHGGLSARWSRLGTVLTGVLLIQLALGALLRHQQRAWALYLHILLASAVLVLALIWCLHVQAGAQRSPSSRLASGLLAVVGLQIALGIAALIVTLNDPGARSSGPLPVLITTAHQTNGAAVLALAVALLVWQTGAEAARGRPRSSQTALCHPPG